MAEQESQEQQSCGYALYMEGFTHPEPDEPIFTSTRTDRSHGPCFVVRSHQELPVECPNRFVPPGHEEEVHETREDARSCFYKTYPAPEKAGCIPGQMCDPPKLTIWVHCSQMLTLVGAESPSTSSP